MAGVVPLALTPATALRMVRDLAKESGRIVILNHCRERMLKRNVTRRQIELCLQKGTITEGPIVNARGNWQVNMFRHAAGEELTCTVAIEWATRLLVITVYQRGG
jgi:hypothetical protein